MDTAPSASTAPRRFVRATAASRLAGHTCATVTLEGRTIALFRDGEKIRAVDNRCPHMGFPLDRGSVTDGILTCHWHHARFDLKTGGAFDLFADDVRAYPVEVREGEIWIDLAPPADETGRQRRRVRDGLERGLDLVTAKSVIALAEAGVPASDLVRDGIDFGVRNRRDGWGQGLTILACMGNLLPRLEGGEHAHALFHGLAAVAADTGGEPPRFDLQPLPDKPDPERLERWFKEFVEVRDEEGAERCLISVVRSGAAPEFLAGMLFASATDHRYLTAGHVLDFINKAVEALDQAGWDLAEPVLASLVPALVSADRAEESSAWRHPIDLVDLLDQAFEGLPAAPAGGGRAGGRWEGRSRLVETLLGDDPFAIVQALLQALGAGASAVELADAVVQAAALRIARFHVQNEFGDWDTALHTFTFANAVSQGLRRCAEPALLRGVFDAAMSVYLDRFLNIPPARTRPSEDANLADLAGLLDRQQRVDDAGALVAALLASGDAAPLKAELGRLLLREDRDFHTIQCVEAAFRQHDTQGGEAGRDALVAAARYLAAHSPTPRAQTQTYRIARRLHAGDKVYEAE